MSTTTYYISYEQPRRPPWRLILLILLAIVALGLLAGIAYGIYALASADAPPERKPAPLGQVLMSYYRADNTFTAILADSTQSIADAEGANLAYVQAELLSALDSPVPAGQSTGRVALETFAQVEREKDPTKALQFHALDKQTAQAHHSKVAAIRAENRPTFIYDIIAKAHRNIAQQGNLEGDRAIVVVTDGDDGGYLVVDPTRLAPCPLDIPTGPDEVCTPLTITIPIDPEKLMRCPPHFSVAHDAAVCMPVSDTADAYYPPVEPDEIMPCLDDGPTDFCADIVVDYEPINPDKVALCPPELDGVSKDQACVDLRSDLQLEDLLAMLATGNPPVTVHTIGLGGSPDNHENLQLIAKATGGDYYHCTRRGCLRSD